MTYNGARGDDPALADSPGTAPDVQGFIMSWLVLFIAGLFEVAWAVGLKYTEGFTRPLPTVATLLAMGISMGLLGLAMRELPVGTAYAVWTGIGAIGTVTLGIVLFGDSASPARLFCLLLIFIGLAGLKILSPS